MYLDIISWLESKINNTPVQDVIRQKYLTAVKHKLPIVIVIFNNSKLGMNTVEQEAKAGVPDYETDMYNPDFAAFAKLCGGDGLKVSTEQDLQRGLASLNAETANGL